MAGNKISILESVGLRYMLSIPAEQPDGNQRTPVLCFLHGYDEGAPTEIRRGLTRHGPLRPGSAPQAVEDFVVVAPQLPRAGDLWYRFAEPVRAIVEEVQRQFGGDAQRTYLSGFSFGGNGVFDLAELQPDFWAALWAVDPTRVPAAELPRPVWLSIGQAARRGTAEFIETLGLGPAQDSLDGDRLYLDEGEDHVGSAKRAYEDERIYRWLLSKRGPSSQPV